MNVSIDHESGQVLRIKFVEPRIQNEPNLVAMSESDQRTVPQNFMQKNWIVTKLCNACSIRSIIVDHEGTMHGLLGGSLVMVDKNSSCEISEHICEKRWLQWMLTEFTEPTQHGNTRGICGLEC